MLDKRTANERALDAQLQRTVKLLQRLVDMSTPKRKKRKKR